MSDALDFLIKARPDAMPHYFAFLKQCGNKLDPKTRDLISVITKVYAQTERGFRQYLKRALRDGCSAEEIIDALLMAFPALGFTKIVWAVDQILAMDLPEFQALVAAAPTASQKAEAAVAFPDVPDVVVDALPDATWHNVMPADLGMGAGHTRCITIAGRGLVVHRSAKGWQVWDNRCPHQGTAIEQAHVQGTEATCAKHGWRFDLVSGTCVDKGDRPLVKLASRVEAARLQVWW